ncbi:hypothetical protein, partial [Siminovitchia terrae]|uniref:hypothetical protein n=1 Tax=Siminovitchia terrae TaxID=1914933 RepID=UPI0028AA8BDF
ATDFQREFIERSSIKSGRKYSKAHLIEVSASFFLAISSLFQHDKRENGQGGMIDASCNVYRKSSHIGREYSKTG